MKSVVQRAKICTILRLKLSTFRRILILACKEIKPCVFCIIPHSLQQKPEDESVIKNESNLQLDLNFSLRH